MRIVSLILILLSTGLGGCASASRMAWEQSAGGVCCPDGARERAARALGRVSAGLPGVKLRVSILNTPAPAAYSFHDGSIYVSRGLLRILDDDELAAAMAHELGHLLIDRVIAELTALEGAGERAGTDGSQIGGDVEARADHAGRQLLIAHGIETSALTTALEKVAAASVHADCYCALCARVERLKALDREP